MNCPLCNQPTRIKSSRPSGNPRGYKCARLAHEAASWYTFDWVARTRVCTSCSWTSHTIELLVDDLNKGWSRG